MPLLNTHPDQIGGLIGGLVVLAAVASGCQPRSSKQARPTPVVVVETLNCNAQPMRVELSKPQGHDRALQDRGIGRIEVHVQNMTTGEPIEGVQIDVPSSTTQAGRLITGAITDSIGHGQLDVAPGSHHLRLAKPGYKGGVIDVDVGAGEHRHLLAYLDIQAICDAVSPYHSAPFAAGGT